MTRLIQTYLVPGAVLLAGGYFLVKTKMFFVFDVKRLVRGLKYKKDKNGTSPLKAMLLALAGTLGVGNIVGVGGAIALGGAGALFWMWLSSLFAMMIKYAEVTLALGTKGKGEGGGAMTYIKSPLFSRIFALLCLICALTLGSGIQSEAVYSSLHSTWNIPPAVGSCLLAALVLPAILKGKGRIIHVTSIIVPVMTAVYMLMCLAVMVCYRHRLPSVFSEILSSAFDFSAIAAGGGWAAIRYGVLRGLISNEAGCGTAPIAHSATDTDCPAASGCFGIVEVFVDTVLLCTMTGVCLLLVKPAGGGMEGIINCFSPVFGKLSGVLLSLCLFFFAYATMVCWFYYGGECISHLVGGRFIRHFALFFCLFSAISPLISSRVLWGAADMVVSLMTLVNLFAVMANRKIPVAQLRRL